MASQNGRRPWRFNIQTICDHLTLHAPEHYVFAIIVSCQHVYTDGGCMNRSLMHTQTQSSCHELIIHNLSSGSPIALSKPVLNGVPWLRRLSNIHGLERAYTLLQNAASSTCSIPAVSCQVLHSMRVPDLVTHLTYTNGFSLIPKVLNE